MNRETPKEKLIHRVFILGLWIKAFDGVMEIFGGIALLFTGTLTHLAEALIRNALIENPHNFIALKFQHSLPEFFARSGLFGAIYLFAHGFIKIFLVASLLRNKLWAYPLAIGVFTSFIVYQLYRYAFTHSVFLLVLTALDILVIWLTWHEYGYFKKYRAFAK